MFPKAKKSHYVLHKGDRPLAIIENESVSQQLLYRQVSVPFLYTKESLDDSHNKENRDRDSFCCCYW